MIKATQAADEPKCTPKPESGDKLVDGAELAMTAAITFKGKFENGRFKFLRMFTRNAYELRKIITSITNLSALSYIFFK